MHNTRRVTYARFVLYISIYIFIILVRNTHTTKTRIESPFFFPGLSDFLMPSSSVQQQQARIGATLGMSRGCQSYCSIIPVCTVLIQQYDTYVILLLDIPKGMGRPHTHYLRACRRRSLSPLTTSLSPLSFSLSLTFHHHHHRRRRRHRHGLADFF